MFRKICGVIIVVISFLASPCSSVLAEKYGPSQDELRGFFYSPWIGVKAPEFDADVKDHLKGPQVRLDAYKGKRLLLYSYYTGNFVDGPPKEESKEIYKKLFKAIDIRDEIGSDKFEIIIVTVSPELYFLSFLPPSDQIPEDNKELRRLNNIPVIMIASPSPYEFLTAPGAIVIDRNGIIQSLYSRPMTEDEVREAATDKDWSNPVKPAPGELRLESFHLSNPSMREKHVWSKKLPNVTGIASANFDEKESYKLIAVNKEGKLLVISSEGDIEDEINIPVKIGEQPVALHGALLEKEKMAFTILDNQNSEKLTVFDRTGKILWEYPESGKYVVKSAAFTHVSDEKQVSLLVSLVDNSNKKELHLVSSQGKKLWQKDECISTQGLAFINQQNNMPGLILRPKDRGGINLFDSAGKYLKTIAGDINPIGIVAADAMNENGFNQMITILPYRSFTNLGSTARQRYDVVYAFAAAMNFEGCVLWKLPLKQQDNYDFSSKPIIAADLNNDGIKEWLIRTLDNTIIVVDTAGLTIANFKPAIKDWSRFSILPRKGKNALIIFSSHEEINAYELEPIK